MAPSIRLEMRQGTALVMTPQLQQSIKLLQLSNLELAQFVASELKTNPLLESPDYDEAAEGGAGAESEAGDGADAESEAEGEEAARLDPTIDDDIPARTGAEAPAESALPARARGLREHLVEQLHADIAHPIERLIGLHLIDALDEAGYLTLPLDELALRLGSEPAQIERVLAKLQRFDPPGVFARDVRECLRLQLAERNRLDPAMAMLVERLDLVAAGEYGALKALCGVGDDDLAEMLRELKQLAPKPGLAFETGIVEVIVPDVIVRRGPGGEWLIELNAATLPRVLIDRSYYLRLKKGVRRAEEKNYLSERYQQANWLIKALDQRARTILRVAHEIVRQQEAFFEHGIDRLKPMILKDVAAALEIHESTVSRVVNNKYMLTPRGTFELKYFFGPSLGGDAGAPAHAASSVRHRIRRLIEEEDPAAPLSDERIVELLQREGIAVARRTVAKYRESMRLGSSVERRREKKRARAPI